MDAAAMAEWMKINTPGPQHAALMKLVGTFSAETTMTMAPGTPPITSSGETENKMVLNGRYLQGVFKSNIMGVPFNGLNLIALTTCVFGNRRFRADVHPGTISHAAVPAILAA